MTSIQFTYGWESITPRPMSNAEKVYRKALSEYYDACDAYIQSVDFWQDMREQHGDQSDQALNAEVAMHRMSDLQDRAEEKKSRLLAQMNCPHTHTKPIRTIEGEQARVCILCGAIENDF